MSDLSLTKELSDHSKLPGAPRVSVIMLAYRHEKFIADAIEGVVAQQCDFPFELIIGEDCSPDRTRDIVLEYQRRYPHLIRVLMAERNVGMHANAGRCFAATRGPFLANCEGDDFWHHPRKLQMQMDVMSSGDVVCCHTDFDRQTRFGTRRAVHRVRSSPWLAQGNAYVALLHEWSVMTATAMYRRDVCERFGRTHFASPDWPFSDWNFLLYASQHGNFSYIDVSTTTFRKVLGSAGNSSNLAHLKMKLAAEECMDLFLAEYPVDPATELEVRALAKKKVYRAAFLAERRDLMELEYEWLRQNGCSPSRLSHLLRLTAVATKFPARAIGAVMNFVNFRFSAIPS
jgi:glycosyltransferase involved in cell wall biosynthesis